MSADEAVKCSWLRLRKNHLHNALNPEVKKWEEIGDHLAAVPLQRSNGNGRANA